jgi:P27 family predicted phage terminase small subunit
MKPGHKAKIHSFPSKGKVANPPAANRELEPEVNIPKPERESSKQAKAEWKRISTLLETRGLIADEYKAALHLYCQSYASLLDLEAAFEIRVKKIMEQGGVDYATALYQASMVVFGTGHVQQHPIVSLIQKTRMQTLKFLKEFGLTPASVGGVKQSANRGQGQLFDGDEGWGQF